MSLTKIGGLGGILGVIVAVISLGMFGTGAGSDPSGADVVSWAADNLTALDLSLALSALALLLFGFFIVALYALLREREGSGERWAVVGLTGGIVTGALSGVQYALLVPLAADPDGVEAGSAGALYQVFNALNSPLAVTTAFMLIGFGLAIHRTAAMPTWTAYLGWVTAALMVIGGLAVVSTAKATGVGLATLIGLILFLVWALALGVLMLRPQRTDAVGAGSPV